jgi:hypothetical protein
MFFPVSDWFSAFLLTLAIEVPIALLLLSRFEPDLLRLGILAVFANLTTHPAVWFVFTQLFLVGTPEYTLVAESWAIGAEALFYAVAIRGLTARQAIGVALAANAASFAVGRLLGQVWLGIIQ